MPIDLQNFSKFFMSASEFSKGSFPYRRHPGAHESLEPRGRPDRWFFNPLTVLKATVPLMRKRCLFASCSSETNNRTIERSRGFLVSSRAAPVCRLTKKKITIKNSCLIPIRHAHPKFLRSFYTIPIYPCGTLPVCPTTSRLTIQYMQKALLRVHAHKPSSLSPPSTQHPRDIISDKTKNIIVTGSFDFVILHNIFKLFTKLLTHRNGNHSI